MGFRALQLRRRAKWACLIFVVAFVVMDIASIWWTFGFKSAPGSPSGEYSSVRIGWGRMSVYWDTQFTLWPLELEVAERHNMDFRWVFEYQRTILSRQTLVRIPMWAIIAAGILPTAALWWLDRAPRPPNQCQKCGYDLSGLARTEVIRCPECGRHAPALAAAVADAAAKKAW